MGGKGKNMGGGGAKGNRAGGGDEGKGSQDKGKGEGIGPKGLGGGEGRGGQHRAPGQKSFLKNHRKMLRHQKGNGERDLAAAESAHEEARTAFTGRKAAENFQRVTETAQWLSNRQLNLDWISFKQSSLDDDGLYILTNEQHTIALTDDEK